MATPKPTPVYLPITATDRLARSLHACDASYRSSRGEPEPDPQHSLELARVAVEVLRELGVVVMVVLVALAASACTETRTTTCAHDAGVDLVVPMHDAGVDLVVPMHDAGVDLVEAEPSCSVAEHGLNFCHCQADAPPITVVPCGEQGPVGEALCLVELAGRQERYQGCLWPPPWLDAGTVARWYCVPSCHANADVGPAYAPVGGDR